MTKTYTLRFAVLMFWFLPGLVVCPATPMEMQEQIVFEVRHDHAWGSCRGRLILDNQGVRYETTHKEDARAWAYGDIKQFEVRGGQRLKIYTYEDRKWRLGADKTFEFEWEQQDLTAQQVYGFLQSRTRRPIAAELIPSGAGRALYEFPAKHLGGITGHPGRLLFTEQFVIFDSEQRGTARTWRYEDLESIASGGLYDLTLTTYEQQRFHYASRRVYNFQLQQPLSPETYDGLWRFVNRKKGWGLSGEKVSPQEAR